MRLNDKKYRKLIKLGTIITELGLIVSFVLIAIIDFFFLVMESLDGGGELLTCTLYKAVISLLYLIPQSVLFYGCKTIDKTAFSNNELKAASDKAKQKSKTLFHWWIAIFVITILLMLWFSNL